MGFNSVVFLLNDHMHTLEKSPHAVCFALAHPPLSERDDYWWQQVDAVADEHNEPRIDRQAFQPLPTWHADGTKVVAFGGNYYTELFHTFGHSHHKPEDQIRLLRELAERLGYVVSKKPEKKKKKKASKKKTKDKYVFGGLSYKRHGTNHKYSYVTDEGSVVLLRRKQGDYYIWDYFIYDRNGQQLSADTEVDLDVAAEKAARAWSYNKGKLKLVESPPEESSSEANSEKKPRLRCAKTFGPGRQCKREARSEPDRDGKHRCYQHTSNPKIARERKRKNLDVKKAASMGRGRAATQQAPEVSGEED